MTFSASSQPARRKKKTAYKGGRTKHVRTAARTEWKATKALKSAILQGKCSNDDGKSDMEENENVNEAESDEEYIVGKDRKMTMEERMAMGLCVVTQEETSIPVTDDDDDNEDDKEEEGNDDDDADEDVDDDVDNDGVANDSG
jgi:hypothetical protein